MPRQHVIADNQHEYELRVVASMVAPLQVREDDSGYEIFDNDRLAGHISLLTTNEGYNGRITLLLALDLENRVIAARVIDHEETPGLGDAIEGPWIEGFENTSLRSTRFSLKPEGDFDAITGATITANAVVNAVHRRLLAGRMIDEDTGP